MRVNSKVVKILQDKQGRAIGVEVAGKHRGTYTINAKAVVLTSGGFSANAEQVASYRPEFKGMTSSNQPGATGDGLDLGAAAGGEVTGGVHGTNRLGGNSISETITFGRIAGASAAKLAK